MSVQYSVVFKDGNRFTNNAICFGVMGNNRWHEQRPVSATTENRRELLDRPGSEQAFIQFDTLHNIHPIWYHDASNYSARDWPNSSDVNREEARKIANKNFLNMMKDLLDDLPMLHGLVTIHPLVGAIRVHIKDHTADQIMLALYLFRNLCHYGNFAMGYRWLLASGYTPRFAAVVAHLVYVDVTPGNFGRAPTVVMQNTQTGEYNWCSPDTLGRQGFLNLMGQQLDQFNWKQHKWKDEKGYYRESWFSANQIYFDERYEGYIWDFQNGRRDVEAERQNWGDRTPVNPRKIWHMIDVFSVPGDVPIDESVQQWNSVVGFKFFLNDISYLQENLSQTQISQIVTTLASVCESNGIQARISI